MHFYFVCWYHGQVNGFDGQDALVDSMKFLKSKRGINHLMVEGGPGVAQSFLSAGLVDRAILVHAVSVTFIEPVPSGIDTPPTKAVCHSLDRFFPVRHLFLANAITFVFFFGLGGLWWVWLLGVGITDSTLRASGLELVGSHWTEDDKLVCWSKPEIPWPADPVSSWP